MKKRLICLILILLLLLGLAACKKTEEPRTIVTPDPTYATIHFDMGVYSIYFEEDELPQDMVVEVGSVPSLPVPEGLVTLYDYSEHVWMRYDPVSEEVLGAYDVTQPIEGDLYLVLHEQGQTFTITYTGLEGWDLEGEYVYSYRYLGDSEPLPQPVTTPDGYHEGLYCIELDNHYFKVPALSAHQNLTFTAPRRRSFALHYASGMEGVSTADIDNPNPTAYDEIGGTLVLQPAAYEGKTFRRWVLRMRNLSYKDFDVDGTTVTLRDNTEVTSLTYEMIRWGQFTLEAEWN